MRAWVSLGLDPLTYWQVTPKEARAIVAGANDRIMREYNAAVWMAWHTAAWQRSKRMPPLKNLLMKPPKTWQQQREELRDHLIKSGGKLVYKDKK